MAMQTAAPASLPAAQVVGNAFVEQYYHILHLSPDLVHRFYQDMSVLSRQDPNGVMTTVTTMKNINELICSLDYKSYKAEINTADAQDSYKDGVIVLVTGCLTGKDNVRRKFSQTFFLAPQDKGYFVLNDVFRFVDENEPQNNVEKVNGTEEAPVSSLTPEPEPALVLDDAPSVEQATSHTEVVPNGEEQSHEHVENVEHVHERDIEVVDEPHPHENHNSAVVEPAVSDAQEDIPKKSYASILSSQFKKGPTRIYVAANARAPPANTHKQAVISVAPAPEASAPAAPGSVTDPEEKDVQDEVDGHSIYVRNLPLNVTPAQLDVEFKRFGPIKQGGVQVRSNKQQGFCFGFVEFQEIGSMHSAIQASPVTIGEYQAVVEIKRTTTRVGSSRGRFSSGRGGFRNENNFRGRGNNFSGGRGFVRNDFGGFSGRGDFSGRGRSQGGRGGESYQQGRGRGGRRGGSTHNVVPT